MAQGTPTGSTATAGAAIRMTSGEQPRVPLLMVYPNYFATIGIPIVSGRDFNAGDLAEPRQRCASSTSRSYVGSFAGENPIGKPCYTGRRARLLSYGRRTVPVPPSPYQIVGVVKDSRYSNPGVKRSRLSTRRSCRPAPGAGRWCCTCA